MARAKTKGKAGKTVSAAAATGMQVDLDSLRQKIANYVGSKALLMVQTATEEAVKVSDLSAMKYLFELIGLHPAIAVANVKSESDEDDGIAAGLLAELGIAANPRRPAAKRRRSWWRAIR